MKILLIAINAKYIHSNLAVYGLKAYVDAGNHGCGLQACADTGSPTDGLQACTGGSDADISAAQVEIAEYTINHLRETILADLYRKKPDIAAFSCYLWNIEYVRALIPELKQVLPEVRIWVGGPEVSYDSGLFLQEFPQVELVMNGEGEETFRELVLGADPAGTAGITWRDKRGRICVNPSRPLLSMDELPFMYQDLTAFQNRIIYYESSRGCPFSCSYCMSSIDKRVRFRSVSLVKEELQFFLDHGVPQVKFVDRTFNCRHSHAMEIWRYIKEHDNGITNFHFEISADLLNEEELALLNSFRPGLAQLEIGVQSTNPRTLEAISRNADFSKIVRAVCRVQQGQNIHQHLDLIAGLPYEDLESFRRSFNDVYALKPQQLQLGFLKVLKGSGMHEKAEEFGIVYRARAPYEVLKSGWISYEDLLKLKSVEEMVEVYYNSSQFAHTMEYLEPLFPDAFSMYESLAAFYEEKGYTGQSHSRMGRLNILREFALEVPGCSRAVCEDCLLYDLYLRENSKSRPEWAGSPCKEKDAVYAFYQKEAREHRYLKYEEPYQARQLMHMTHLEIFSDGAWVLFDYRRRNPLNGDAAVCRVSCPDPEG
ncbi:MAG: B12-binding domain-containing radical SAM protein [Candidatus Limivivens sp.]|nr:B12-binding domain-containing radical SAM protein [Candidatus Limivivens sp.]